MLCAKIARRFLDFKDFFYITTSATHCDFEITPGFFCKTTKISDSSAVFCHFRSDEMQK